LLSQIFCELSEFIMNYPLRIKALAAAAILYVSVSSICFGDGLYKQAPGPYRVNVAGSITLEDPKQQREITFRVLSPESDGRFPVVVFSTGGFCPSQMYERYLSHWASHGYVVIAPDHIDSPNRPAPPTAEQMQSIVQTRVREVSFAVDALEDIRVAAEIEAKLDSSKLAVAGHSFGSGVAMMKAGVIMREQDRGPWGPAHDERFRAAILLSPPGGGDEMAPNAFDGLKGPFIATGGTNDLGRVDPGDLTPAEWRRQAYLLAPAGDKYSLIIDGADHYLGGLICHSDRGGEPDYGAVEINRAVTTAFLDAYLRDDDSAKQYLLTADIGGQSQGRADFRKR
jgi:dienelactone hydrolase